MADSEEVRQSTPEHPLRTVGSRVVVGCLVLSFVIRLIGKVFFPEAWGRGLGSPALYIMLLIWTAGLAGAALWLVGYFRGKGGPS